MSVISAFLCGSTATALAAFLLPAGAALAQTGGCTVENAAGGREVLRCPNGVTVTAEAGAAFRLNDRNRDGSPDVVSLRGKAILVDVDDARHTGGFQVVTPQAIAAVRGTQWAVDVAGGRTSVLVVQGSVAVRRPAGDPVVLGPGEGVDVVSGTGALEVRRWPPARAAALLARLGQ
ncbi:FecR family protein [Rhizobium sp. 007]|uniref:FecR family protein n=1 Tax=Rhizobium sp. 007 TaxID=2785056 RepID=UPI0018902902|nr:FecR family protein [Rhizobium sp. 007]QPB21426.1 FecR domain-containing protein [Rhizobium sp. 007]